MPLPEATAEETASFEAMRNEAPVESAPAPESSPEPAPQPEAQPAPEAAAPPSPAEDPAEKAKRERLVPFAAVVEERGKRKALDEELKAAREELARLRGAAPQPPAQQPQEQGIDPLADIESLKEFKANLERQQQEAAERSAFSQRVIAMENEYAAANPDYKEAVDYLANLRRTQLRAIGLSDAQIGAQMAQEAYDTARHAMATEQSPAEVFHALARASGFVAKAPEPAAAAQPAPAPELAAVARLATLQQGQQAARTTSGAGGGAPEPTLSLAAAAKLEGADFDAFWKSGKARQLMA